MNNGLIVCPTCLEKQKKNVLGSVAPNGTFHVLRKNQLDVTIIQAAQMMVICSCGFGTLVIQQPGMVTFTI